MSEAGTARRARESCRKARLPGCNPGASCTSRAAGGLLPGGTDLPSGGTGHG